MGVAAEVLSRLLPGQGSVLASGLCTLEEGDFLSPSTWPPGRRDSCSLIALYGSAVWLSVRTSCRVLPACRETRSLCLHAKVDGFSPSISRLLPRPLCAGRVHTHIHIHSVQVQVYMPMSMLYTYNMDTV